MSRERYELVRAAELKVGDAIFCEYKMDCIILASQEEDYPPWMWDDVEGETWGWAEAPIFRRLPDTDEADVLRRALEKLYYVAVPILGGSDQIGLLAERIDQARRELESEAREVQKGGE